MTLALSSRFVRAHLGLLIAITCVTSYFSYACFHNDEYFQIIELVRFKLGQIDGPLPWEHTQRIRPWLQPFLYWVVARVLGVVGVRDIFALAFAFRLLTGLANVLAVALFLRTTLPWLKTEEEQRLHVRVVTLTGFLPYLIVRTSSEAGSMAALTAGFALLLAGAARSGTSSAWSVPALDRPRRALLAGALLGLAFEMRYQTALMTLGLLAWLRWVGRGSSRGIVGVLCGGALSVAVGLVIDRWGYGAWTFPAWSYFQVNVVSGAAGAFGTYPPFAYLWMLPANLFAPAVLVLMLLAALAWLRCPQHPLTWTTLPFAIVHNLLAHKEERFLFPMAIFATAFVTMALGPSFDRSGNTSRVRAAVARFAAWGWARRHGWLAKVLATTSLAAMALLAFVPLGWHHNARFSRFLHDHIGDELHATALPEIDLNLPAFHPRTYDVDHAEPAEIAARIASGTARAWLITDRPTLQTGAPGLDANAVLVYSELPVFRDPALTAEVMGFVDRYNAVARPPLRQLHFRSLYRLPSAGTANER